jgi:hypothetical protein
MTPLLKDHWYATGEGIEVDVGLQVKVTVAPSTAAATPETVGGCGSTGKKTTTINTSEFGS